MDANQSNASGLREATRDELVQAATEALGEWNPPEAVAAYLDMPVATLAQWRYCRTGPPFAKVGRHVRYSGDAVREWVAAQVVATDPRPAA